MSDVKSQFNELIRQTKSSYYDPKHHGEGFVIIWDTKSRKTTEKKGFLSFISGDRYEYYFVKSHTKPIMIRDVEFSWHEGTSDISLDFNASFQLKISSQEEAAKLVALFAEVGQPDIGLHNLIDKYLFEEMTKIYQDSTKNGKNLLDEFYQNGLQRGESALLNQEVSKSVADKLKNSEFKIGFTLRNAPEHHVYYKHSTPIVRSEDKSKNQQSIKVESDCRLTLSNYQTYKKSGISNDDDLKAYVKKSIDSAIRNQMLGKSLMELLSNFKKRPDDKVSTVKSNEDTEEQRNESITEPDKEDKEQKDNSISGSIKKEVEQKVHEIGYKVESFHTLPDIPALQLLEGITVVFDESDAPIKVGTFGGKIKLNIRMSVKAIDGQFELYKHIVAGPDSDIMKIGMKQIIDAIKKPINSICVEALRPRQQLDVLQRFESKIKGDLEKKIKDDMAVQHGLEVTINNLQPIESEDASRLEELRGNKHVIGFEFVSNTETEDTAKITVTTAFHINTIDFESPNSWDAFERQDFGYRMDSPMRNKDRENTPSSPPSSTEYDRAWKNIAIEDEIQSIKDEIIRVISHSKFFVVDIRLWLFDYNYKEVIEQKIAAAAKKTILKSRGLLIDIEPLITKDETLQKAQIEFRDRELESGKNKQAQRHQHELDGRAQSEQRNQALESALVDKTTDIIDNADEDDDIEDLIKIKDKTLDTAHREEKSSKSSISDFVVSGRKVPQKRAILEDLISESENTQKEQGTGEEHEN